MASRKKPGFVSLYSSALGRPVHLINRIIELLHKLPDLSEVKRRQITTAKLTGRRFREGKTLGHDVDHLTKGEAESTKHTQSSTRVYNF